MAHTRDPNGKPNETANQRAKRLFEERFRRAELKQWRDLLEEYVLERCEVELDDSAAAATQMTQQETSQACAVKATQKLDTTAIKDACNLLKAESRAPATQATSDGS